MLGILVILAISWLLLYLLEKKSLLALGFQPLAKRIKQFLKGFALTAVLCLIAQLIESNVEGATWLVNEAFSISILLEAFWWDFRSVFTEELMFRGAILYILIQRFGSKIGVLASAVAFGVYHWFSYNVLGDWFSMTLVFIGTGLMGYAWALAFAKTRSIMLPIGLHLGWNFVYNSIFSNGPLGDIFLVAQDGVEPNRILGFLVFIFSLAVVPVLVLLYVRFFVKSEVDSSSGLN